MKSFRTITEYVFLSSILLLSCIFLILGIKHKLFKIIFNLDNLNIFVKKNLSIIVITLIYSFFVSINSYLLNLTFTDCPRYDKEPEHKWFKQNITTQIIDILISFVTIVIIKYWTYTIVSSSIDNINLNNYINIFNIIQQDGETLKKGQISHLFIKQMSMNIPTIFITLLFQKKLRNKIDYLVTILN